MPVSSLVLHLDPSPELRAQALAELQAHPAFLAGEPSQGLLPAALATADEAENKSCWRWLNALSGVDFVEVLSVVFPPAAQEGLLAGSSSTQNLERASSGA